MKQTLKKLNDSRTFAVAVAVVYVIAVFIAAINHELWYDEAQAWNIVRDNDFAGIIHQLKFEGHPPLWYALIYPFAHGGVSCNIMPIMSWFFSSAAVIYFIFRAPFGNFFKLAVAASGGFFYFISATSRVYCLIPIIVFAIADIYPNRQKYPVLFGLLAALLANTHICVSGLVGIIGIYMLIDLVKDWKGNSAKQNILNITGLAIAGIGVLCLVVPLLGSVGANSSTSGKSVSVLDLIADLPTVFSVVCSNILNSSAIIFKITALILGMGLFAAVVLMRHKKRSFAMAVVFTIFYTEATIVLWWVNYQRAFIFIYIFIALMWIGKKEADNSKYPELSAKADKGLVKSLLLRLEWLDKNAEKCVAVIMAVVLCATIPNALCFYIDDIIGPYSISKETADKIRENIPANSVIVSISDDLPSICAYLPDYKFYALDYNRFYSYVGHNSYEKANGAWNDKAFEDLSKYDKVYYIFTSPDVNAPENVKFDIIFTARGGMDGGETFCFTELCDFTDFVKTRGAEVSEKK